MRNKTTLIILRYLLTIIIIGGISILVMTTKTQASTIKVNRGEGLSNVAKRAGYTNWYSPNSWSEIAKINGYSDWKFFNDRLKPNQIVKTVAQKSTQTVQVQEQVNKKNTNLCTLVYNYLNWNQDLAYAVCMAESGGNPNAYNPEYHYWGDCNGSRGLFQVGCAHGWGSSFNPETNVKYANQLWAQRGWQPWGAYTSGAYLKFY